MSNPDESRARLERLIAAADRVAQQPVPPPSGPTAPRWLPFAALAVVAVGVVALGVNLASGGDGGGNTAQTTAVPTAVPTGVPSTSIPTVITLPPTSAPPVIVPSSGQTGGSTTTAPIPAGAPVRWTSYEGASFVLRGRVPGRSTADALVARFAAGAGMDHVVDELSIASAAPLVTEEPLFAAESLQFQPGSAELQPTAVQFLDVFAAVLRANPAVSVDVRGYTQGTGSVETDLLLSQQRVDAVAAHLVGQGIAVSRLTATGYGSSFPLEPDTAVAGQTANDRVEFTLHHLLG